MAGNAGEGVGIGEDLNVGAGVSFIVGGGGVFGAGIGESGVVSEDRGVSYIVGVGAANSIGDGEATATVTAARWR